MKKSFSIFITLTLMFLLTLASGCGETKKDNSFIKPKDGVVNQNVSDKPKIALVMKTLTNPFFIEMEKGARKAEKELKIDLMVKQGAKETSIDQQIIIVEDLIKQRVQAIVIAPGDSKELIPVLKKAQDAGIYIINIDNKLDANAAQQIGLKQVPFISVDNVQGGYLSAKTLSDRINVPTEVAIIEGIRGAINSEDRKNGALKAFRENPNINIVAIETANWKIDEGLEITKKILNNNPNVKAIFCANDMMALGAIEYLKKVGRDDILIAGYDALEEAKKAIREGSLVATIDQQPILQGYVGVQYALNAIQGEKNQTDKMVNLKVLTKDNLR